jgi:hypothetical protein
MVGGGFAAALSPSAAGEPKRYANRLTPFDMRHVMRYT